MATNFSNSNVLINSFYNLFEIIGTSRKVKLEVYFGNFGSDALQLVIFGNGEKDVVYFAHDSARHVFLLRHWGVGGHLDEHSEIVCGVCF